MKEDHGGKSMTPIKLVLVLTLLIAASGPGFAQSQPNYGPGGSGAGDTFGKPPSGSAAAQQAARHHHYRR
jgi:hypothetical protein